MTLKPLALALMFTGVLLAVSAHAAVAEAGNTRRLDGDYRVTWRTDLYDNQDWRFRARCGAGACATNLRSEGGLAGVLRFRRVLDRYEGQLRVRRYPCTLTNRLTGETRTVPAALIMRRTIIVYRFRGFLFGATRFARGKFTVRVEPTDRGRRAGCFDSARRNVKFRLAHLGR